MAHTSGYFCLLLKLFPEFTLLLKGNNIKTDLLVDYLNEIITVFVLIFFNCI